MNQKICDLTDLSEHSSKEFTMTSAVGLQDAFLVYVNKCCYAYINHCPHTGVNLNWQPDVFLSVDSEYIQCSMHGAIFEITNGRCLRGPCQGQNLTPVELMIKDDAVYLA